MLVAFESSQEVQCCPDRLAEGAIGPGAGDPRRTSAVPNRIMAEQHATTILPAWWGSSDP